MTPEQINQAAADLAHYGGGTTLGDLDLVHMSGDMSRKMGNTQARYVRLIVTNNDVDNDSTILLSPGLNFTQQGKIQAGTFTSVEGNSVTLTEFFAGQVAKFIGYIYQNPSELLGIKITGSTATQTTQAFTMIQQHPWKDAEPTSTLYPTKSITGNTFNDQIAEVDGEDFVFSSSNQVSYTLLPSASATIEMWFGVSLDVSKGLEKKIARAKSIQG